MLRCRPTPREERTLIRSGHPRLRKAHRPPAPAKSWNTLGPISVFLVVALLSTLIFGALRGRERAQKRQDFVAQAQHLAFSVENHFDLPLELLRSVAALFVSSDRVSRDEFAAFVRPIIARHPSIYAFEWMPLVTEEERDRFEEEVRKEGFPRFRFQQKNERGELVLSERRREYLPIAYMEPLEEQVLGLDVVGPPERDHDSVMTRRTGTSTASGRYSLVEDPADVFSVISYAPVRKPQLAAGADGGTEASGTAGSPPASGDGRFLGLVAVLLRIEPVAQQALAVEGIESIHVLLRDESAPPDKQILFSRPADPPDLETDAAWMHEFDFADRRWSVRLTPLRDSPWALGHGPVALWGAGILLAGAAAYGSGAALRIGSLRRRVDEAEELGQYRLGRLLGEGGMGVVYRADHRMLARPAAIKLIRPGGDGKDGGSGQEYRRLLDRFEREARATAALHSPHTIQVYDFGRTDDDQFYYVMELLDGLDLETLVREFGPVQSARTVHILRQACRSLAEAHAAGLVHRDIKPANIYVCRYGLEHDFVKVLDFGLVRDRRSGSRELTDTHSETFVGTPAFCAPEMAEPGSEVDGRSDLYALGCVAYWLLTGRTVFGGRTQLAHILAHVGEEPGPPSAVSELPIPPDLEAVVMACLEKDPARRPATAEDLERRLRDCSVAADWNLDRARQWWEISRPDPAASPM